MVHGTAVRLFANILFLTICVNIPIDYWILDSRLLIGTYVQETNLLVPVFALYLLKR